MVIRKLGLISCLVFSSISLAQDYSVYQTFSANAEEQLGIHLGTGLGWKNNQNISHFIGPEVGVKFDLLPKEDGTFKRQERIELLGSYQLVRKVNDFAWSNKFYAGGSRLPIDNQPERTIAIIGVQTGFGEMVNDKYFGLMMGLRFNNVDSSKPTKVGGRDVDQALLYFGIEGILP